MYVRKNPDVSLKVKYPLVIRVALVLAFILVIGTMTAFPKFKREAREIQKQISRDIETESVVTEQQVQRSAPPQQATVPIRSEDENLADDSIAFQQQSFEDYEAQEWSAPPPPPESDENESGRRRRFIAYDEAPQPIGGYTAIQNNIKYPEMAREAGIEGRVLVRAFIDKNGNVQECEIEKGIPNTGLNEAAIEAIRRTSFNPAMQRDRKVGVWITIPVRFRLDKG